MFARKAGEPTKVKKIIYLVASMFLGLLLSLNVHAFIEIIYLRWAQGQDKLATFYGGCSLHPLLQLSIWLLGGVGGYYLGKFWWRKVYIEKVWAKNNPKNLNAEQNNKSL